LALPVSNRYLEEKIKCFYAGSKSEPEEAAAAEDIATSLFDQDSFSLQVVASCLLLFPEKGIQKGLNMKGKGKNYLIVSDHGKVIYSCLPPPPHPTPFLFSGFRRNFCEDFSVNFLLSYVHIVSSLFPSFHIIAQIASVYFSLRLKVVLQSKSLKSRFVFSVQLEANKVNIFTTLLK
jgi:hypothetical protein